MLVCTKRGDASAAVFHVDSPLVDSGWQRGARGGSSHGELAADNVGGFSSNTVTRKAHDVYAELK